jgi:hypothetical protein
MKYIDTKKIIKICIIIFIVIITILLEIFIIYKIYSKIHLFLKAINFANNNTLQCGKLKCSRPIEYMAVPNTKISETFDPLLLKYCGNLVNRIENAITYPPIKYPPDNLIVMEIQPDKNEAILGMVTISKQSDINDNVIWITFRGTISLPELQTDLNRTQKLLSLKKLSTYNSQKLVKIFNTLDGTTSNNNILIHSGFLELYLKFRDNLLNKLNSINSKFSTIVVCGHSLGAAISTIVGLDMKYNFPHLLNIVYNFASPKIGNQALADEINKNIPVYRMVNTCDIVPTLPYPVTSNYQSPEQPYFYTHCGKAIYFSDNWKSTMNNHLINVYLNNIDKIL